MLFFYEIIFVWSDTNGEYINKINSKEDEQYKNVIQAYLKIKKPSRELLSALIGKIVVDKEQNIEIYYNFKPLI